MNETSSAFEKLGLKYNPFPPATTGVAFVDDISMPQSWEQEMTLQMNRLDESEGDKALAIVGGYGSGKTFMLNWIARRSLPPRRVHPYFFDNPGVAFYDLANRLMRQIGRYELSKAIWEMFFKPSDRQGMQLSLIELQFPEWLKSLKDRESRNTAIQRLSRALQESGLATDEEISNKFARVVIETRERPYYEYRDFVPRTSKALVAEQEEASYFSTLVRILLRILEARGIAFLIDEFEDVALGRRLNRKQVYEYVATIRRLLDTAREENLWVILSMTPEGFNQTTKLNPSLMERFSQQYEIPPLTEQDAYHIMLQRLKRARIVDKDDLSPFPDEVLSELRQTTKSSPRRLIKVLWHSLALAREKNENSPICNNTLRQAEEELYPGSVDE